MDGFTTKDGEGRPMTAKELRRHDRASGRLDLGLCPNGCGKLTETDLYCDDCGVCGFHYRRNIPRNVGPYL